MNMKLKEKYPRGRPRSRWKQEVREDVTQREGREKVRRRRSCKKTKADGQAWLSDDIHNEVSSEEEEENK
jgi:hypothetical protein